MASLKTTVADVSASLDDRSREVFRRIVETYLDSGDPLGSRNLSRLLPMSLSPASVRNVMSDLEDLGLIYAPHVSAGRLPTQAGLRFFVDAFMQVGDLSQDTAALLSHCRLQLPAYMVPTVVHWVPGPLPRNPNGKLDRQRWKAEYAGF